MIRTLLYIGLILWASVRLYDLWFPITPTDKIAEILVEEKKEAQPLQTGTRLSITDHLITLFINHVNPVVPASERDEIIRAVRDCSLRFALDPYLVLGVIRAESSGRFWVNNKGCLGLMQVRKSVWHEQLVDAQIIYDDGDYFRIRPAVMAGCFVLSRYMNQAKGNVDKALALYSGGAGSRYMQRAKSFMNEKGE